jgi:hypothetical protein
MRHVDDDPLREVFGPARLSHAWEFQFSLAELRRAGVEIDLRPGAMAYSPATGQPGRFIFDPDASVGALCHEMRHFRDVRDDEYPGLRYYLEVPARHWRLEYLAYLEEVKLARQARRFDIGRRLLDIMRAVRGRILG